MYLSPDRPFLISPPFGSWLSHPRAYSVLGSFTVEARSGRLGRVLKTVRPVPSDAGPAWINKIGLRNGGLGKIPRSLAPNEILSLAPLALTDWHALERFLDERFGRLLVEFNVSCPNVEEHPDLPHDGQVKRILANVPGAIFKLPPVERAPYASLKLAALGVRYVHLSNTIPSPIGGISGAPLREVNLPLVERTAREAPELEIIAGGGIYTEADVTAYAAAGARRFSLSTAWFWPPRARRVMRQAKWLQDSTINNRMVAS